MSPRRPSLPNDVRTPFVAHPDLVHPPGIDVDAVPDAKHLPGGLLVARVRDGEPAAEDEVGGEAAVRVGGVVGIGAVGPREDAFEPPRADLVLGLLLFRLVVGSHD